MRKLGFVKIFYVIAISTLLCLSVGSTYAYFSSNTKASAKFTIGNIDITWRNANGGSGFTEELFEDVNSINVTGELKRDGFTKINVQYKDATYTDVRLQISNRSGTVPAYCRMQITATYTPKNSTQKYDCSDWIKLALDLSGEKVFITDLKTKGANGWVFVEGPNDEATAENDDYYYYASGTADELTFTELLNGQNYLVADHLYLSSESPANILGSKINITLTLEGVQSANEAYKSVWGLD